MATTYNGITSDRSWENLRRSRRDQEGFINVGNVDRIVSGLAAAAVAMVALRRRRLRPLLLPIAGSLITRAITGRSSVSRALGRNRARADRVSPVASVPRGEGIKVERSALINRPVHEVYQFWRNFENLPRFMDHLESVTVTDETTSHWVAKAPAGTKVEWDAVIHNEIPNQLIAWRSLPGADVNNAGSVHFTETVPGSRTEVRVVLSYEPPAGRLGAVVAKLLGEEPSKQVEDDLRRFKQVLESSELTGTARRNSAGRA